MGSTLVTEVYEGTLSAQAAFADIVRRNVEQHGTDWYAGAMNHDNGVMVVDRYGRLTRKNAEALAYDEDTVVSEYGMTVGDLSTDSCALAFPFYATTGKERTRRGRFSSDATRLYGRLQGETERTIWPAELKDFGIAAAELDGHRLDHVLVRSADVRTRVTTTVTRRKAAPAVYVVDGGGLMTVEKKTLAEAVAFAKAQAATDPRAWGSATIERVVHADDGEPLVSLESRVHMSGTATFVYEPVPAVGAPRIGWVFAAWVGM